DPDNVTLVGMSSGAFTIAALFGVDDVAELYRRVWLMSGPASRIIAPETAAALAGDFLDRAGVAPGDGTALRALPIDTILATQEQVLPTHLGERHPLGGLATGRFRDHRIV